MNEIIRKKLNLLVHLANIDGDFDQTEHEVLESMIKEAGGRKLDTINSSEKFNLNDLGNRIDKPDILYWALRMIKADGIIHPDESAYCKALAVKLNYKPEVIDFFTREDLGDRKDFKKLSQSFSASSVMD